MSKRLQVLLDEHEMADLKRTAAAQHMTVAEWVRQALRKAQRERPVYEISRKIQVVREATKNNYPTGDIDEMLNDINRGALEEHDS